MIDINHPNSKYILEASSYTDRIKGFCQIFIKQNFESRKKTFEKNGIEMYKFKNVFREASQRKNYI